MRQNHTGCGLARGQCPQSGHRIVPVGRADRGESRLLRPVVVERVSDVGERHVCTAAGQPVGQVLRRGRQTLLALPTHHQGGHRRLDRRKVPQRLRSLLQHHVGVRAAETERRNPRAAGLTGGRPPRRLVDHLQAKLVERDVRVGRVEVLIRGDLAAVDRQRGFDQSDDPRRRLEVPEIRLGRTDQQRRIRLAAASVHRAESASLDRVAEQRTGAVRFHVIDLGGLGTGVSARRPYHRGLGGRARRHQPVGPAVGVDRGTADDSQHPIPVTQRVGQPLENYDPAALAADVSVGCGVEGVARAGRRHRLRLVEAAGDDR